jgi:hypothetical protein
MRRRVRAALAEAHRTVARSESLVAARVLVRERRHLAKRCAWCGRMELGAHWTPPEELPAFLRREVRDRISHGICPDCLARLERQGHTHALGSSRS